VLFVKCGFFATFFLYCPHWARLSDFELWGENEHKNGPEWSRLSIELLKNRSAAKRVY